MQTNEWLTPLLENLNLDRDGNIEVDESPNVYLETSGF